MAVFRDAASFKHPYGIRLDDDATTAGVDTAACVRRCCTRTVRGGRIVTRRADLDDEPIDTSHLDDVADGCGCTEIWEHMSEERDSDDESG